MAAEWKKDVFDEVLEGCDVLFLQEIGDPGFYLNYSDFDFHFRERQHVSRRSGGVGVLIRKGIDVCFELLPIDDVSSSLLGLKCAIGNIDVFLFGCYMPSTSSTFHDENAWTLLGQSILDLGELNDKKLVMVFGDINGRVGMSSDGPSDYDSDFPSRASRDDHAVDANGRRLIDLCSTCSLGILNGRVAGDEDGEFTFRHVATGSLAVLDYVLGNMEVLQFQPRLVVGPQCIYESGVSDHCPITCTLKVEQSWCGEVRKGRWCLGKVQQQNLASFLATNKQWLLEQIEDADSVEDMGHFVAKVVEDRLRWLPSSIPTRRRAKQPWYTSECMMAYRQYRGAWKAFRRCPTDLMLSTRARALRNRYFTVLRDARRKFDASFGDYMQRLFQSSQKEFHKKLFPKQAQATDSVDLHSWFDYFEQFFAVREVDVDDPEPKVEIALNSLSDESLVVPFTEMEVAGALGRLQLRTCGGIDAWTPAFFKGVGLGQAWLPILRHMFNRCLEERQVPKSWLLGMIRPIWKRRGSRTDPFRYRPIMLCTIWYKLFMYVLMERLIPVLDPIRHPAQAGFRLGCETTTWVFVLWGLMFRAKKAGSLLILLSLDLQKAYDSVVHSRLWLHLERLGLHHVFVEILKFMYGHSGAVVRGTRGCTAPFGLGRGVRQGCPLSPLLYTLYHDNLPRLLELAPMDRVVLGLAIIVALIFADDSLVPCQTVEDVETTGRVMEKFEEHWQIKTNVEKTEALAINAGSRTHVSFRGIDVELKQTLKYLGVLFSDHSGDVNVFREQIYKALRDGHAAVGRLLARARDLRLEDPRTMLALFRMYVLGKIQYASPVWSMFLTKDQVEDFNRLQLRFLKHVLRLPSRALRNIVYLEMGALPVIFYFRRNTVRFWNRVMTLPEEHSARQLVAWLQGQPDSRRSWWTKFRDMVRRFEPSFDGAGLIDVKTWSKTYTAYLVGEFRGGFHWRLLRFYNRVTSGFAYTRALSSIRDVTLRTIWVCFRVGKHGLAVDVDGAEDEIDVSRYCPYCAYFGIHVVESEEHFLFACSLYANLRQCEIFELAEGSMYHLFNMEGQHRVAMFIRDALELRRAWMNDYI